MPGETLLYLCLVFAVIPQFLACDYFSSTDIIADLVYNDYYGYDVTEEKDYNPDQRRAFCKLATMGNYVLFQESDLVQGDFHKELLDLGHSLNIYAIKCTEKYNGNQELWIGKGPTSSTVAVYIKLASGTGVFLGAMTDINDKHLPTP